ncbi:hybrid sensor histidine kinase/response regulator [Tautonia plasticadhaerens]|nr:hybrid sensor histidine kinase/response regulator [Tautonia plasticadhaerens]
MPATTEMIRGRSYTAVGEAIARDAESIIEAWADRARAQGHGRPGSHRAELRDHLPSFLRCLGDELATPGPPDEDGPRRRASEHGRFRWQVGWDLASVVVDYQLLQVVLLEHLRSTLGRDPSADEVIALGVHLDDAVSAAVVAFVEHQEGQLDQAHRRLNEFLGVLGHELRNPLGTISVALQLARMGGPADEDLADALEVIGRSVGTMSRLMDDMLDVARITRGDLELRPDRVRLADVVSAAVEATRPIVEERRHTLTVSGPPPELTVEADPTRLQQVIVNLLTNAAKYTPPGGAIELLSDRDGASAVVRVRDTGAGIAPEFLPQLFELFSQAPEHNGKGLGIGLALVRSLVEQHGGTISAQSDGPGSGSTFVVRLPLADPIAGDGGRAPAPPAPGIGATPRRILIVDDERDAARILSTLLEQDGHAVRVALDGASALVEAADVAPDLVLLDLALPDLDGSEVARRLRDGRADGASGPMIVALTGYGPGQRPGDDPATEGDGFDLFLTKPVGPDALARVFALLDHQAGDDSRR